VNLAGINFNNIAITW